MNVYVETNFVLEIAFEQEQLSSCQKILQLCESGQATFIIPAYSLAEPHEKLFRQAHRRRILQQSLNSELRQLLRTASYVNRIENIQNIASLLLQSNVEDLNRFVVCRERILAAGEVIALTVNVLKAAAEYEVTRDLSPQDALVYSSVVSHLRQHRPQQACFLNRNYKDFETSEIAAELKPLNCRIIRRFDDGYQFIQSQLSR